MVRTGWMGGWVVRGMVLVVAVGALAGEAATLPAQVVSRASVATGGTQANGESFSPTLSRDGRVVAFGSLATNLGGGCSTPAQVYVHDRTTGATACVSVDSSGTPGNGSSGAFGIALSPDGRLVAFTSDATNLGGGCTSGVQQIFVHDRATGATTCASVTGGGTQVNNASTTPALSGDARLVAFASFATNLVTPDAGFEDVLVARLAAGPNWLVTGAGAGGGPHVRGFDALAGATPLSLFAYNPAFPGGVRVATGDLTGAGTPELITGAGPGGGPHVRIFSGPTGTSELAGLGFFAYESSFTGGVFVAAGKVGGGPAADLVTGPGEGRPPWVRIFALDGFGVHERGGFFAYDPAFQGGVRVAACDVDGDGQAEIITGPGPGGGPDVRVYGVSAFGLVLKAAFF